MLIILKQAFDIVPNENKSEHDHNVFISLPCPVTDGRVNSSPQEVTRVDIKSSCMMLPRKVTCGTPSPLSSYRIAIPRHDKYDQVSSPLDGDVHGIHGEEEK